MEATLTTFKIYEDNNIFIPFWTGKQFSAKPNLHFITTLSTSVVQQKLKCRMTFSIYTSAKACRKGSVASMVKRGKLWFTFVKTWQLGGITEKKQKRIHESEYQCSMIWLSNQHCMRKCETKKKCHTTLFSVENKHVIFLIWHLSKGLYDKYTVWKCSPPSVWSRRRPGLAVCPWETLLGHAASVGWWSWHACSGQLHAS